MPPKQQRSPSEDTIEALLDPRVIDALVKALGTKIAEIVESRLDDKLKDLFDSVNQLKKDSDSSHYLRPPCDMCIMLDVIT